MSDSGAGVAGFGDRLGGAAKLMGRMARGDGVGTLVVVDGLGKTKSGALV